MSRKTRVFSLLSLVFLLLVVVQPAAAHGYIVRAIPENRAVLERAPTRLQYWFSEGLEPEFSSINVRDQNGAIIATGGVDPEIDTLMRVQLPPNLPDGAYIVELRPAFASDGHVVAESRVFFVGQEVGGVSGQAAAETAIPLEVLWRALHISSSMLLFGLFTLYAGVLVPAWGSRDYPAGLLPPRVMTRLYWATGLALLLAFAANVLALLQQSMAFFNTGITQVIEQSLWGVVRIGSRFGDVWNFRMIFLAVVAALFFAALYYRKEQPRVVRASLTASAWVMALVLGTSSVLSHAAGSLTWPWVGVTFDWLHALGVGFWVGGLMALVLVLPPALKPYTAEQRRLALLAVLRRFSRIATAAVVVVIATGIYSASNWVYSPSDLQTGFGLSLGFKVALVLMLVALGAAHHVAVNPDRFRRFAGIARRVGDFSGTLRLEVIVAAVTLVAAGLVTATPVPVPDFAENEVPAPIATQRLGDYEISMTITPGGPGVNTYDAQITRDGAPVEGLAVQMQKIAPDRDWRSTWTDAEPVDSGLYVSAGDEIDAAGEWWTLLDIRPTDADNDAEALRVAFDWTISDAASVLESRDPTTINLIAFAAVIAALAWAFYPDARRLFHVLDLSPTTVTLATGAVVGTVIFMAAGFVLIQETQRRFAQTINPPPLVVNTTLPTQDSLQRGADLFADSCAWDTTSIDFAGLRERLPRTRDDELFLMTREGWRSLRPCDAALDESQRWDVVNYLRTFETDFLRTAATANGPAASASLASPDPDTGD